MGSASARDLRKRLSTALVRERRRKHWTQEQAAEAASVHPRHYQKLEKGSVNVTIGTLERLCGAFGIDVRRLFDPSNEGK